MRAFRGLEWQGGAPGQRGRCHSVMRSAVPPLITLSMTIGFPILGKHR
jgi:hypothetical protein